MIVEAALTVVVFAMLLFGIIEFGTAFYDYLTSSNVTRTAARIGSTMGNAALTDYQILQKVKSAAAPLPPSEIQQIIIYKASGVGAAPDPSCKAGSVTGLCNTYVNSDMSRPSTDFGCGSASPDRYWCPTSRVVSASGNSGAGPDYLGVYIRVLHKSVTGMFGPSFTFAPNMVLKIEAQTP